MHTALPWIREQAQDGEVLSDGTGYAGEMYDTNEIISVDPVSGEAKWVASCSSGHIANLITTACNSHADLLAACKRGLEYFGGRAGLDNHELALAAMFEEA